MNAMRAAFAASAPGSHRYFVIGRMQTRAIICNYRLMAGNGGARGRGRGGGGEGECADGELVGHLMRRAHGGV